MKWDLIIFFRNIPYTIRINRTKRDSEFIIKQKPVITNPAHVVNWANDSKKANESKMRIERLNKK